MATASKKTLLQQVTDICGEAKARYVLWKLGVMYGDLSFDDLSQKYLSGSSYETVEKYAFEENVQKAMKLVMKAQHNDKMIQLYDIYFERAKEDTQAFRAFTDFSKSFFADNEEENELQQILDNVDVSVYDDDDDE